MLDAYNNFKTLCRNGFFVMNFQIIKYVKEQLKKCSRTISKLTSLKKSKLEQLFEILNLTGQFF